MEESLLNNFSRNFQKNVSEFSKSRGLPIEIGKVNLDRDISNFSRQMSKINYKLLKKKTPSKKSTIMGLKSKLNFSHNQKSLSRQRLTSIDFLDKQIYSEKDIHTPNKKEPFKFNHFMPVISERNLKSPDLLRRLKGIENTPKTFASDRFANSNVVESQKNIFFKSQVVSTHFFMTPKSSGQIPPRDDDEERNIFSR